jgi:hypothetical protein
MRFKTALQNRTSINGEALVMAQLPEGGMVRVDKTKIMSLKGMNGSKTLSVMSKKISRCQIMEQLRALLQS